MAETTTSESTEHMQCEEVGKAYTEISGVYILASLAIQAGLSIMLAFYAARLLRKLLGTHSVNRYVDLPEDLVDDESRRTKRKLDAVNKILLQIGDIQVANGIALMLACFANWYGLSLYNWSIVYNTVNFSGISTALALWTARTSVRHAQLRHPDLHLKKVPSKPRRHILEWCSQVWHLVASSLIYFAFIIIFGIRLGQWSEKTGHCYRTDHTSTSSASHPVADEAYLGVTAAAYFVLQVLSFGFLFTRKNLLAVYAFLTLGTLQYVVHIWWINALRRANEKYLEREDEAWGFGPLIALVILVGLLLDMLREVREYFLWKRDMFRARSGSEEAMMNNPEPAKRAVSSDGRY